VTAARSPWTASSSAASMSSHRDRRELPAAITRPLPPSEIPDELRRAAVTASFAGSAVTASSEERQPMRQRPR
jgi:hypothetical protein